MRTKVPPVAGQGTSILSELPQLTFVDPSPDALPPQLSGQVTAYDQVKLQG